MTPPLPTEPMEPIPLVDLKKNLASIETEVREAIDEVLKNTAFIMGPTLSSFEDDFASLCGTQHAIGVSSGLEALIIAMRCLGIGPGDEVILPANTFIATALGVSNTGATPVLVDVDPSTDLCTVEAVEAAISPRTRAIAPVHLYGRLVDCPAFVALAKKHDLLLLEDAAQAHGARLPEGAAGSFGHAAGFSFYPGKNLGAFGDGGAITTNDETLARSIQLFRNYGSDRKYYHDTLGSNTRLDAMQAAILHVKLRHLPDWNRQRVQAAAHYDAMLLDQAVERPELVQDGSHVYHLYPIRVPDGVDRDAVLATMNAEGIGAGIHYPVPIHLQKAYESLPYSEGAFPVSEDHAKRMISLPIFPEITRDQQERVVKSLLGAL